MRKLSPTLVTACDEGYNLVSFKRSDMPTYTYRCESCGIRFDQKQSFQDAPLTRCPECNENSLRKVIAPVGIVFKGSGWYATDHKSPSGAARPVKNEGEAAPAKPANTETAAPAASSSAPSADAKSA
jgi:putative FmdB family regulatory protein